METSSESDMTTARTWARTAVAGEYLARYLDTAMGDDADPGSRCGYGDDELAELGRILAKRDLRLVADDRGLIAMAIE